MKVPVTWCALLFHFEHPNNKVSNNIRRHTDNRKLLLICILLLSHSFIFFRFYFLSIFGCKVKVKVSRNRPGQAQRVPGRLRPRIFLTFGTAKVVDGQPYTPTAFTLGEIPGTHF